MRKILLPLAVLLISDAVVLMGSGLMGVLIPVRAGQEGFPELVIGLLISMYFGGLLLGCLLCPFAIRRAGHIRTFAAMTAIAATVPLLHVIFQNPAAWLVLRFVTGICFAGITMALESWLNDLATPQSRGRILSVYTVVNLCAITAGQLSTTLGNTASFELFAFTAILISLAAVPLALTRAEAPEPPQIIRLQLGRLYALSPVGVAGCAMAGFVSGPFWGLAPVAVVDSGAPLTAVPFFMSAAVFGGALAQWPLGWLSDIKDRRIVLILAALITSVAGLLLTLMEFGEVALLTLAALYGAGMLPLYALSVAHANDYAERGETVQVSSGLLLVFAIGATLGPVLASVLVDGYGGRALFGFTVASLAVFILFVLMRLGTRPKGAPEETRDPFVLFPSTSPAVYRLSPLRRSGKQKER